MKEIAEAVKSFGEAEGLTVIDLYTLTENHPEWFREDGVHPNVEGAGQIAGYVYDAVTAVEADSTEE